MSVQYNGWLASDDTCLTGLLGGDHVLHAGAQSRVPLLDERGDLAAESEYQNIRVTIMIMIIIYVLCGSLISNQFNGE